MRKNIDNLGPFDNLGLGLPMDAHTTYFLQSVVSGRDTLFSDKSKVMAKEELTRRLLTGEHL